MAIVCYFYKSIRLIGTVASIRFQVQAPFALEGGADLVP